MPDTDDPDRFVPGAVFTTPQGRTLEVATVKSYRDRGLLIRFEGVAGREEAERLRGSVLTIAPEQRRHLEHHEFWPDDLVGLAAIDPAGSRLGIVDRVELGPGQARLVVVTDSGAEALVPFVAEIVGDPTDEAVVIDAPEGLFPE